MSSIDRYEFDPIEFLGLEQLSPKQKSLLYRPLLADMAGYMINAFTAKLDENKLEEFLRKFEEVKNNPIAVIQLMDETMPEFENKKIVILSQYRDNFKLQKFQTYL